MSKKKASQRPDPAALGLPLGGVDSHAHLDLEQFAGEIPEVLDRARAAGVHRIGNVFLGPEAYQAGAQIFKNRREVFFLLGVHPNDAEQCTPEAMTDMRRAFGEDNRLKALGEIGLDFYWDRVPRDVQERAFRQQLSLARDMEMPVVIHSRDADDEVLRVLLDEGFEDRLLLWHCFGGGPAQAERILELGWFVSIPGPVTFPKNQALREAARIIPLNRLLLETDCPFLAPQPWRGKRNEPAYLGFSNQAVAEAKGLDPAETWLAAAATAAAFFGI
ncbi:MAG: TatD family hydrolase [Desulfovibrionaceae bacterium]